MNTISLSQQDIIIAAILVVALSISYFPVQKKVGVELIIAALRALLQLSLIGLILTTLFENINIVWVMLIGLVMLLAASREAMARQQFRLTGLWAFSVSSTAMFISSFSLAYFSLAIIIQAEPWYAPQYAVPFLGMLLGNTMNAVSLSTDRLTSSSWHQRALIEQKLMLGERAHNAIASIRKDAIRTGMTPIINAMATAGIVNLPGMMTGQILAGAAPYDAVKYQLLILFMITVSSGLGIHFALWLVGRRLFDERQRLRLDRMKNCD